MTETGSLQLYVTVIGLDVFMWQLLNHCSYMWQLLYLMYLCGNYWIIADIC